MFCCPYSSALILARYSHLYERPEKATSVEIKESIRAMYGTSHVLDEQDRGTSSSWGEEQVGDTSHVLEEQVEGTSSSWGEKEDNLRSLSSSGSSRGEEVFTDEETGANIFICPLCGEDFGLFELFSEHNTRNHKGKIVHLEEFKYTIGAV